VIHKTKSTKHVALSSEEDRATATDNKYRKCGEMWTCGFVRYDSGQTDRETNRQRQIDHITLTPNGAKKQHSSWMWCTKFHI